MYSETFFLRDIIQTCEADVGLGGTMFPIRAFRRTRSGDWLGVGLVLKIGRAGGIIIPFMGPSRLYGQLSKISFFREIVGLMAKSS